MIVRQFVQFTSCAVFTWCPHSFSLSSGGVRVVSDSCSFSFCYVFRSHFHSYFLFSEYVVWRVIIFLGGAKIVVVKEGGWAAPRFLLIFNINKKACCTL